MDCGLTKPPKIEMCWLQPLDGAKQRVVAAFMNKYILQRDQTDMGEEAIVGFECSGGLSMLEGAEGVSADEVWKILPDGTAVASDKLVTKRGT